MVMTDENALGFIVYRIGFQKNILSNIGKGKPPNVLRLIMKAQVIISVWTDELEPYWKAFQVSNMIWL